MMGDDLGQNSEDEDQKALTELRRMKTAAPADLVDDPELRARRLYALRRARGWSQRELARTANLGLVVPGKLEHGDAPETKIRTLIWLARSLGVSLDYFATDDGETGYPPTPSEDR